MLNNLELKGDALNNFNLPFSVKKGFIGKLVLKVPWKVSGDVWPECCFVFARVQSTTTGHLDML